MTSIVILVGSETGNSLDFAERTREDLERLNYEPEVYEMDEFSLENLLDDTLKCLIFICSTTGDGEEPRNMHKFMKFMLRSDLPSNILSHFTFSVFGLGDSSYDKFNFASKRLYRRMQQLGAKDFVGFRGEGDERNSRGIEGGWTVWFEALKNGLKQQFPVSSLQLKYKEFDPLPPRSRIITSKKTNHLYRPTKDSVVEARFIESTRVTPLDHFQDTRLLKIRCVSDETRKLAPGDILNLKPSNNSKTVDELLSLLQWDGNTEIFGIEGGNTSLWDGLEFPLSLKQFLQDWIDLHRIPTRSLLRTLACLCDLNAAEYSPMHREKLVELSREEGEYLDYVWRPKRSIVEIIKDFQPTLKVSLERLLQVFPPMKARQFSIANDPTEKSVDGNYCTIELLVALVKEELPLGRGFREGLTSAWIRADLIAHDLNFVSFTHGSIRHNLLTGTIFLFASGTGIAPLRSIIQRYHNEGRRIFLYFGCRSLQADFYFENEWKESPNLTVFAAGSRDGSGPEKIYLDSIITNNSGPLLGFESPDQFSCVVAGHSRLNKLVQDTLKAIWSEKSSYEVSASENDPKEIEAALAHIRSNIARGVDVNKISEDGVPGIVLSATLGHLGIIKELLNHPDIDVNAAEREGNHSTALIIAVKYGFVDLVEAFLKHPKIKVEIADINGYTALHWAIKESNIDMFNLLLPHVKDLGAKTATTGKTVLHLAVTVGNLPMIEALLERDETDVNVPDEDGFTPIHMAAMLQRNLILSVLMAHPGADVNASSKNGSTPLHLAISRGNTDTVQNVLLRNPKVKLDSVDLLGETPLQKACELGLTPLVFEFIKQQRGRSLDLNRANLEGETALMLAAKGGFANIVMKLLSLPDISVDCKNIDGDTALHLAAKNGYVSAVVSLMGHSQVKTCTQNKKGKTAFQLAIDNNRTPVAEYMEYKNDESAKKCRI